MVQNGTLNLTHFNLLFCLSYAAEPEEVPEEEEKKEGEGEGEEKTDENKEEEEVRCSGYTSLIHAFKANPGVCDMLHRSHTLRISRNMA